MRFVLPLTAAMLFACSTSAPTPAPSASESDTSVGSSAAALRKLGQADANDVQQCRDAAQRCTDSADSGSSALCDRISAHCDALEAQLAEDRADLEQCLQQAADCEQGATDPAQCAEQRAACDPTNGDFRQRRGRTMECANKAEQCIAPGRRGFFGRRDADAGDAGAVVCDDDAVDFVGCCHGGAHHEGDAGIGSGRGGFGGFGGPGIGFPPPGRPGPGPFQHDGDDDGADAGAPRRGGMPTPPPFRRAP
jgi:hypothetical protein